MTEAEKNREFALIRTSGQIFSNATCVFVEYMDCVKIPWFTYLAVFRGTKDEKIRKGFHVDFLKTLDTDQFMDWYFNRKYRNPLASLWKGEEIPFDALDRSLQNQMMSSSYFYDVNLTTNVVQYINNLLSLTGLVQRIIIHNNYPCDFIEKDIKELFGGDKRIEFMTGSFEDCLPSIPTDTTYIFSDIMKVMTLIEHEKINYSSFMLPIDFRYNYTLDSKDKGEYMIDMNKLEKEYLFKWATYRLV